MINDVSFLGHSVRCNIYTDIICVFGNLCVSGCSTVISDVLFTCSYTHIAIDMLAISIAQLTFQPMSECEYTEIAVH